MLKRKYRLAKIVGGKDEKVIASPFFNLRISKGEENQVKFGFVVSKKINKSAVARNRTKRILKAGVLEIIDRIIKGKNIILVSKKDLEWKQKEEVGNYLKNILKKEKFYK